MNFVRQGFRKSSDRHPYKQTDRQTESTEIIKHAASITAMCRFSIDILTSLVSLELVIVPNGSISKSWLRHWIPPAPCFGSDTHTLRIQGATFPLVSSNAARNFWLKLSPMALLYTMVFTNCLAVPLNPKSVGLL